MSGHSKWSKIKRQKEVNDKGRAVLFTKLSRLVTMAVIEGGNIADPQNNVHLRMAIEKARSLNMPKDNIERAIEKAAGPSASNLKEIVYEGFSSGKIALLITATTDNPNRTASVVRNILEQEGGKLGVSGSASYLFKKVMHVEFPQSTFTEDEVFTIGERVGATDIEQEAGTYYMSIPFQNNGILRTLIKDKKEVVIEPYYETISESDTLSEEANKKLESLVEELELDEDVQKVFTNT